MQVIFEDALKFVEFPFVDHLFHQVNCQGVMGGGIALHIRNKYPKHFNDYTQSIELFYGDNLLGHHFKTDVTKNTTKTIVGVFGQDLYGDDERHTNYTALISGIRNYIETLSDYKYKQFAIPYEIGCELGGGDWNIVKTLLEDLEKMLSIEFVAFKFR